MRKSKLKIIFLLSIIFIIITLCICICNSSKLENYDSKTLTHDEDKNKQLTKEIDEFEEDDDAETKETDKIANKPENESIKNETTEDESINEEQDSITLSGSYIEGNPGSLIININIETGDVSGHLIMNTTELFLDGNTTHICNFLIEGDISGTLDLETRIISGTLIGEATTEDEGCLGSEIICNLNAELSKDYSYVKGSFITPSDYHYKFIIKK